MRRASKLTSVRFDTKVRAELQRYAPIGLVLLLLVGCSRPAVTTDAEDVAARERAIGKLAWTSMHRELELPNVHIAWTPANSTGAECYLALYLPNNEHRDASYVTVPMEWCQQAFAEAR